MKKVHYLSVICFLLASLFGIVFLFHPLLNTIHAHETRSAIDLAEAIRIGNTKACEWDRNAQPYFITSIDEEGSTTDCGSDGKRRYWNFLYTVKGTNRHLVLTIHDKKVVNFIPGKSEVNSALIIETHKIKLRSADAVAKAKKVYGLLPGITWAVGYQFVLDNDNGIPILTVVGIDPKTQKLKRISFHGITGKIY